GAVFFAVFFLAWASTCATADTRARRTISIDITFVFALILVAAMIVSLMIGSKLKMSLRKTSFPSRWARANPGTFQFNCNCCLFRLMYDGKQTVAKAKYPRFGIYWSRSGCIFQKKREVVVGKNTYSSGANQVMPDRVPDKLGEGIETELAMNGSAVGL